MDSQRANGESHDASRKERRKLQNTLAQRKYRNKQREKTRELERLLSTTLAPPSQPYANTPGPESQVAGNQFYTEQALSLGGYYGSLFSSGMATSALTAPSLFDFPTSGGVSLDGGEGGSAYRTSQTSPSSNLQFHPPRSFTQDLSIGNSSAACPSFQDSVQASVYGNYMLGTDPFYSNHGPETASSPAMLKASQILSYLCTDSERRCLVKTIESEELNLRDIVKLGLAGLGATMEVTQFDSANDKPAKVWISEVSSACAPCDIKLAAWTGVRVILQRRAEPANLTPFDPRGGNMQQQQQGGLGGWLPDISANTIMFKCTSWMSASVANAEFLRIPLELLLEDSSESPFTQQGSSISGLDTPNDAFPTSTPEQAAAPFRIPEITSDLAPTMVQYTKSHHPYLDLIPWPSFRSKAIIATSVTPPLIDEEDLCLDLMNGALRCWGSMRSQHGRGEGAPWDMRSWEAAPWFIDKWAMLMDGDGGEIARNSAWWRNQNGMPSLN